jgi:hypothetical protein
MQEEGAAEEPQQLDEGEEKQYTIQITEDQMLDIAEGVFQLIADRLKTSGTSIKKAFGKKCQMV